jgi:hypothetical protein
MRRALAEGCNERVAREDFKQTGVLVSAAGETDAAQVMMRAA